MVDNGVKIGLSEKGKQGKKMKEYERMVSMKCVSVEVVG
jgi:hypothetical protein